MWISDEYAKAYPRNSGTNKLAFPVPFFDLQSIKLYSIAILLSYAEQCGIELGGRPLKPRPFAQSPNEKIRLNLATPTTSPKYFLPLDFEKILKNSASPIGLSTTFV